eukprot:COSAG05_NODE_624_length_8276_cov_4.903265_10_plen_97_part_00
MESAGVSSVLFTVFFLVCQVRHFPPDGSEAEGVDRAPAQRPVPADRLLHGSGTISGLLPFSKLVVCTGSSWVSINHTHRISRSLDSCFLHRCVSYL